jgi:hypothetical protein
MNKQLQSIINFAQGGISVDTDTALEACPFCRHDNVGERTPHVYFFEADDQCYRAGCPFCYTLGPVTGTPDDAVSLWNCYALKAAPGTDKERVTSAIITRYGTVYPVSTLDYPIWHMDLTETLNWMFRAPEDRHEPEYTGRLIWFSISERNSYCDRGHYLVRIVEGSDALKLDAADEREGMYYMSLVSAIKETVAFARWRLGKERAETYPQLRTGSPHTWVPGSICRTNFMHDFVIHSTNPQDLAEAEDIPDR